MTVEWDRERGPIGTALGEALTAAEASSGRLVLLLGEAGIGKTTTARQLASRACSAGFAVRWAGCWSGGATVAHAPWLTLLSGLGEPGRRAMDSLLGSDEGSRAGASAARATSYAAVVRALEDAAANGPILLAIDDLHWADDGTLRLLDVVAAQLPGLPVLVVGTYRDTEVPVGSPLTGLGGGADRLSLHSLDGSGVVALLADSIGAERAGELAAEVGRLTGGNPFLVVQIGRLLADGGGVDGDALPTGARDLLRQRLDALDGPERQVLQAAAVLTDGFRPADLHDLVDDAGLSDAAIRTALEHAAALRIVEPTTADRWLFVHDLFRQAALDGVERAEVHALHRRAAGALAAADAEPAVVAAHLLAGGPGAATDAATWSVRAGDRAIAALAWEEAACHYERALASAPLDGASELRAEALAGLGRARLLAGDLPGAARAFDELAALARSTGSAEMLAKAALGYSADLSGFEVRLFEQRQIDLLEEARLALGDDAAPELLAPVLARLSVALSLVAPDARRLELADAAVALARDAKDPTLLARALAAHCDAISGPANVGRREVEATEIIAIAEAERDGPLELLGRRLRFVARLEQGDVGGVDHDMAAYTRRTEAVGNPLYSWYVPLWKAQFALVAGQVDTVSALLDRVEALGAAAGSLNAPMLAKVMRLLTYWQQGQYQEAQADVEQLAEVAPDLVVHLSAVGNFALCYLLAGKPERAAQFLDRLAAAGLDDLVVDAEWLPNMVSVLRAAAGLGHPLLADTTARLEPCAGFIAFEGIGAGLYGSAARFVAIGCRALGRDDDAVRYARQAVAANRAFGGTLVADALRTLAECLESAGDDAEAGARHAEADAAYASVGATHLCRDGATSPMPATTRAGQHDEHDELRREGEIWHLRYRGVATILKHSKGLADLAVLLARPGQEVHVAELEGLPAAMLGGSGGDALDRRAIAAYRDRLAELAEDIDDAEATHDLGRAERAREEYDTLVDQLAGAVGIGGRSRSAGPEPVERLRKAVSARIRDAIRRVDAVHPALGRHLASSVHTGTYCWYRPEIDVTWHCQA